MTDKQIIIDGVDVSGCECYSEHREGYCGWHIPCEGDTCPYKLKWALQQLKRKEQECKALREEKAYTDMACEQFEQKLEKIKDYCKEQNLKADWTACEVLKIIEE